MKVSRNDPCPCGSGKKYQRCCMGSIAKQHAQVFDDVAQTIAMNPNLTLDELNLVTEHKVAARNNRPNPDFCGLSASQMANWLYSPFNELTKVSISTPNDLSASPVMRYLALILEEAMQQEGSFKATTKGNLPAKVVKQASDLLAEFAIAQYESDASISEFTGSNEDKFNALHYTRILAEISGIIYCRSGRFHVKKDAQKQYKLHGIKAFFLPMFEAATTQYNWGYFDSWEDSADINLFWIFMLWRLQGHGSIDQLIDEVAVAFPDLVKQFSSEAYYTQQQQLGTRIESRFIERFLQFWGFATVNPKRFVGKKHLPRIAEIQPLLIQSVRFSV